MQYFIYDFALHIRSYIVLQLYLRKLPHMHITFDEILNTRNVINIKLTIAPRERTWKRTSYSCRFAGCWSHSSAGRGCAYSHSGKVFILRKRDIDRNGGRMLYGLCDSWGRCIRRGIHVYVGAHVVHPIISWWQIFVHEPCDIYFTLIVSLTINNRFLSR